MKYRVNDLYACIQGEGQNTGLPMALLRLHGCPVGCPWCDTKETWAVDPDFRVDILDAALGANPAYCELPPITIAQEIRIRYPSLSWVLLTGGEPAEQPLAPLVAALQGEDLRVALETSGTAPGHVGVGLDWVCVSPKFDMPGGKAVRRDAVAEADEITWVVGRQEHIDRLLQFIDEYALADHVAIAVQPLSQSSKATDLCIEACHRYGWHLSIQAHKYLNIR